jgi:hypothetical protein
MKTNWKALILGSALLAGVSGTAAARDNVHFSLSFGAPAYTYIAPPPPVVYYAPPPVVYYRPAPQPVYYAPPAWGVTISSGYRGWDGRHHGHHYYR